MADWLAVGPTRCHIPRTRAANVDPVAVAQFLHRMMYFVVLNEIVVGVEKGADLLQGFFARSAAYFMPADRSDQLASVRPWEEMGHASGDDHSRVWRVVDQVVCDAILAALPDEYARRMPIDLADMMDVVV
jgi:hypothetical protein